MPGSLLAASSAPQRNAEPNPFDQFDNTSPFDRFDDPAKQANPFDQFDGQVHDGLAMNATAGLNEGTYSVLGLPVDAMTGALNLGIRGINAATGSDIGTIDDPFLGSRSIAHMAGKVDPRFDLANTVATTGAERIARGAGMGTSAMMLPAGMVGALSKTGVLSDTAAATAGKLLGNPATIGAADAATGALAGASGNAAAEAVPDQYKPLATLFGNLAGGGAGAFGSGLVSRLGSQAWDATVDAASPLWQAGRERLAGQRIHDAATNPAALPDALADAREIVPGSRPTIFQTSGDMGLGALERDTQTRFPAEFNQRRADQNAARRTALDGIQPTGGPETVSRAVRERLSAIDAAGEEAIANATGTARTSAEAVGSGLTPDVAGERMRGIYEAERQLAKNHERRLWDAVDPDGSLVAPASNLKATATSIIKDLPKSAKAPDAEEAAILGVIGSYGEAMPFKEVTALRSRISDAMRQEKTANGESASYRRLTMLRGSLENDIEGAIQGKVAQEADAVARGKMSEEQTILARLQNDQKAWYGQRNQQEVVGKGTGTGGQPWSRWFPSRPISRSAWPHGSRRSGAGRA